MVTIEPCEEAAGLYRRIDDETGSPLQVHIRLHLGAGTLSASADPSPHSSTVEEVSGGVCFWSVPPLTAHAANRMMREIAPLAEEMLSDWTEGADGGRRWVVLGARAQGAQHAIQARLAGPYDPVDIVTEWDLEGATNGDEAAEYGITADTTDGELRDIEQRILRDLARVTETQMERPLAPGEHGVAVAPALLDYLREARDDIAGQEPVDAMEIRSVREYLGLSRAHFARLLEVRPETIRKWEEGWKQAPGRHRPRIAELVQATDQAVVELTAQARRLPSLVTYRTDADYLREHPHGQWSAQWHRQVSARVRTATGLTITHTNPAGEEAESA